VDKQQKLKIALPVLAVIMALVWGPLIFGSGSSNGDNKSGNASKGAEKSSGGLNVAALSGTGGQKQARTTYTEWGQNPFMLKRAPKALYIEGIMWDTNDPKVIINGDILSVGGVVEDKTIIEIKPNSVLIRGDDGEDVELKY